MKKTNYLFLILIGLCSITGYSQTFTWGNPFPSSNETDAKLDHYISGNSLYQINIRYNEKIFNREINVNALDIAKLNKIKSIDLSTKQPVMGMATSSNLELFQESGVNFILFMDDFNTKTKERELYYIKVNIETGTKSEPVLIAKMPGRNTEYNIVQSDNRQFYGVTRRFDFDKKSPEKINAIVFDKDLKSVSEISYVTPYMNRTNSAGNFYISNQGNMFFIKVVDLAKEKPFKTLYFWDKSKQAMTETSLKFDNDYSLHLLKGHFLNDDFYIHGLYTRIGSKAVQVYGGNIPANGFYAAKFNKNGEKIYIEKSETKEIGSLLIKDFVFDGMKTWFFGDKMFTEKKSKPVAPGQSFNWEYDYSYFNDAIVFGKLDNETGKLEWFKDVPFSEEKTMNDNGRYLSYLYFVRDNQLTILYNDTQKTLLGKRTFNDRFIMMEKYDDRGNKLSGDLIAGNGLEIEYADEYYGTLKDNFDLDTSVNIYVQDGKYIVRAKSPSNEKYGYLKF